MYLSRTVFITDPGMDDEMAYNKTNNNGEFILNGVTEERTHIDGVVKIYHDCDDWLVSTNCIRIHICILRTKQFEKNHVYNSHTHYITNMRKKLCRSISVVVVAQDCIIRWRI